MAKAQERRKDEHGEWRFMTEASNYVMARRPGCVPRVFHRKDWDKMPTPEDFDAVKALWDRHTNPSS